MSKRWSPPGKGWIRTWDSGNIVIWMRPENDGVSIAMYTCDYFWDGDAQVWIVRVPKNSWIPSEVMDKPHRIRWIFDSETGEPAREPEVMAYSIYRKEVQPSHHGHRRLNYYRKIWRWPLPRKIRNSLIGY